MLYSYMVAEIQNLTVNISNILAENEYLKSEINRYKEQLDWFKRQVFGKKSERVTDIPCNTPELPGLDLKNVEKEILPKTHINSHERKKSPSRKGEFKLELGENIPVKKNLIDIPETDKIDPATGKKLVCIGYDISDKLATEPEQHYILRTMRPKYTLKDNSLYGIVQAKAEDCIIEGSKFDASFMAYLVTEKFCHHMPLYRIAEKLKYQDIKICRQSLTSLVIGLGLRVQSIVDLMKEELFKQKHLFTDATPVNFIADRYSKTIEGTIWVYVGNKADNPPYQIYEFTANKQQINPINYLKNFEGIIHADAYRGYVNIDRDEENKIAWAACWVHGRRGFEKLPASIEFRNEILKYMRYLFLLERAAWKKSPERRLEIRNKKERPIVDLIFKKLREKLSDPKLLPKSKLYEAIRYMLSYEKNFRVYLECADAKMENNTAERAVRKIVIGRKNWLYVGSQRSGKAMANLMTLIQTCRVMNINPQKYMEHIFRNLMSYPHKQLQELLPDQWNAKAKVDL